MNRLVGMVLKDPFPTVKSHTHWPICHPVDSNAGRLPVGMRHWNIHVSCELPYKLPKKNCRLGDCGTALQWRVSRFGTRQHS